MRALCCGALFASALFALGACKIVTPVGQPCTDDAQCGSGFDCWRQQCFRVCTSEAECPSEQTCYRYHCINPGEENAPKPAAVPSKTRPVSTRPTAQPTATPPTPDVTALELRAMRREIELLRQDVKRLLESHGHGHSHEPKRAVPVP